MEQITISKKTAQRLLERMADWLEYIESLDTETRADVVALDELINALGDGEEQMAQIEERHREEHRAAMERAEVYRREQAEKAGE